MSAIVQQLGHSLTLLFFGIGMKTDLFQSCGHCWVFQICWHIDCSTFTALSFRIWTSSAGIPSPALALPVVMLPEAHSTSYSRMSGSRWVITALWLAGSWTSFLYNSSVYSCHFSLISSASVRWPAKLTHEVNIPFTMIHEVDYYPHFTDEETKALRSLMTYKQSGAELAFKPVCRTSKFISSPSSVMILDTF